MAIVMGKYLKQRHTMGVKKGIFSRLKMPGDITDPLEEYSYGYRTNRIENENLSGRKAK